MSAQTNRNGGTQDEPARPDLVARIEELTKLLEPAMRRDKLKRYANSLLMSLQKNNIDRQLSVLMNQ